MAEPLLQLEHNLHKEFSATGRVWCAFRARMNNDDIDFDLDRKPTLSRFLAAVRRDPTGHARRDLAARRQTDSSSTDRWRTQFLNNEFRMASPCSRATADVFLAGRRTHE